MTSNKYEYVCKERTYFNKKLWLPNDRIMRIPEKIEHSCFDLLTDKKRLSGRQMKILEIIGIMPQSEYDERGNPRRVFINAHIMEFHRSPAWDSFELARQWEVDKVMKFKRGELL